MMAPESLATRLPMHPTCLMREVSGAGTTTEKKMSHRCTRIHTDNKAQDVVTSPNSDAHTAMKTMLRSMPVLSSSVSICVHLWRNLISLAFGFLQTSHLPTIDPALVAMGPKPYKIGVYIAG
jgi:hypothetical protein